MIAVSTNQKANMSTSCILLATKRCPELLTPSTPIICRQSITTPAN